MVVLELAFKDQQSSSVNSSSDSVGRLIFHLPAVETGPTINLHFHASDDGQRRIEKQAAVVDQIGNSHCSVLCEQLLDSICWFFFEDGLEKSKLILGLV